MRNSFLAGRQGLFVGLALIGGAAPTLTARVDPPSFWKTLQSKVSGKADKEAAVAADKVAGKAKKGADGAPGNEVRPEMIGTWVGEQDGMPGVQFTLVLNKDKTSSFGTRVGKQGSPNAQKGTYRFEGSTLTTTDDSEVGGWSKSWKMVGKTLVLDGVLKLKKR